MEPADAVLRFLESVSPRAETDFYLGLFRALPKERFAAISVDASVARHASEAVVLDLRFLAALGLTPLVVLGLFDAAEAQEQAARLRRRLERAGVPSVGLAPAEPDLAEKALGALRGGAIPVLAFGREEGGSVDERVARFAEVVAALATRKVIFLSRRGGLTARGRLVPLVNLTTDVDALLVSRDLNSKQRLLVTQSRRLVFQLVPHPLSVAITSPLNLLRELFTTKGAGTLLRRGAVIERHDDYEGLDLPRLVALVGSSFGRPLRADFFDRPVSRIYLEQGYRGAAIVVDTPLGSYLTKFAVEREAQGEGIGRDLWDQVAADHAKLIWRARAGNPIGEWYLKLCHGMARLPDWQVFWKGLAPMEIAAAIEFARAQPVDIPAEAEPSVS